MKLKDEVGIRQGQQVKFVGIAPGAIWVAMASTGVQGMRKAGHGMYSGYILQFHYLLYLLHNIVNDCL
ncbi:MAG: hypothetical protein MJE68_18485 [Proteobacteria bacterium]|nr:hypothetical protein [Pseudomonadota bacterium]